MYIHREFNNLLRTMRTFAFHSTLDDIGFEKENVREPAGDLIETIF